MYFAKRFQRNLLFLVVLLAISACNSDPYPKDTLSKSPDKETIFPAMSLNFSPVMEFKEGEAKEYKITATVQKGQGIVTIYNLPQGATYDPSIGLLRWSPSFNDGSDPDQPEKHFKNHTIRIRLESTEATIAVIEKEAVLQVQNVPRSAIIWTDASASFKEGQAFQQEIILASDDFPDEQIQLAAIGMPGSSLLEMHPTQKNKYTLKFVAPLDFVKPFSANGSIHTSKTIEFKLQAVTARGTITEKTIQWIIQNNYLAPIVSAPKNLTSTGDISFSILANDLNKESTPVIRLLNRPNFGLLTTDPGLVSSADPYTSTFTVRWYDIPLSEFGKTHKLEFAVCTLGLASPSEQCTIHPVQISFTGTIHFPPTFDRSSWPLGTVKKVVVGESLVVDMPIRYFETQEMVSTVSIIVSNEPSIAILWVEGKLIVKGIAPGLVQFDINATSQFGLSHKESMIVEVVARQP